MEYPLCDQTVTVYRLKDGQVCRQVLHGCYFQLQERKKPADERPLREFLLVVPGNAQRVFPGDWVVPGEGPRVSATQWAAFLPVHNRDMVVVGQVRNCYWEGTLCHTEATD